MLVNHYFQIDLHSSDVLYPCKAPPFYIIFKKKKKLEKWYSEMRIPTNGNLGDTVLDLAVINCMTLTM